MNANTPLNEKNNNTMKIIAGAVVVILAVVLAFVFLGKDEQAKPNFGQAKGVVTGGAAETSIEDVTDFADWRYECTKISREATTSFCRIFQKHSLSQGDQQQLVLTATVAMVRQVDTETKKDIAVPVMRFITPMGAFLPTGIALQFTEEDKYAVPFQICNNLGCVAEKTLSKKILDSMHGNEQATVAYQIIRPEGPVVIPLTLSLNGFDKAFKALVESTIKNYQAQTKSAQPTEGEVEETSDAPEAITEVEVETSQPEESSSEEAE